MTFRNQTSTRSKDEIRIFTPWAYVLFAAGLPDDNCALCDRRRQGSARTSASGSVSAGSHCGNVLGCYAVLIGYINQDAGRRSMSRLLWTLIAIFVPNGLGIVLYFVLRKPRTAHCPQCDAEVEPGFSFCPRCSYKLSPSCPRCQRVVGVNDVYCPYCGTSLRNQEVPQV
jgi:hypothetical protein